MKQEYLYGLLSYSSVNIGDEIQSVAQSRFLPRIDEYVQRETIGRFIPKTKGVKTKLIMNAWWMFHPSNFPPKDKYIEPLLISMYFRDIIRDKLIKRKSVRDYLLKHGPVGCRDMGTHEWLKKENIPSYFSGCLSLTLQRNYKIPRQDYILCVNVPKEIVEEIQKNTKRPIYILSRGLQPTSPKQRQDLAKLILRAYHDAHLVISPRLHVILPSLAMETPVLRLFSKNPSVVEDATRYSGYETFFNSIDIDRDNWKAEIQKYDFENPPQNPQNHIPMRNELIKKCFEFTGYDNKEPVIEDTPFPFIKLIQLNSWSKFNLHRAVYYLKEKEILEILLNKIKGITKYDVCEKLPKYDKVKYTLRHRLNRLRYSILTKITSGKTQKRYRKKYRKLQKQKICYELQKYLNRV